MCLLLDKKSSITYQEFFSETQVRFYLLPSELYKNNLNLYSIQTLYYIPSTQYLDICALKTTTSLHIMLYNDTPTLLISPYV